MKEVCKSCKRNIAVHGFGSVGLAFAKLAFDDGHRVIAVSDSKGAIYDAKGLDIDALIKVKKAKGSVIFYDAEKISQKEFFSLQVDSLVLASLENTINKDNASLIKAGEIYEIANAGISPKVESKLKLMILPDILVNAGGVLASFFEWANNRGNAFINEDLLKSNFEHKMIKAYLLVKDYAEKYSLSYREASYLIAGKRILDAMKYRK